MTLDNREIATLVWLGALATYLLRGKSRNALKTGLVAAFRAFLAPKLVPFWIAASIWVIVSIWLLHAAGIWTFSAAKTTLIWVLSFAFLSVFRIVRVTDTRAYLREAILDILSLTAVVEFIAEAYTFPLFIELILMPVALTVASIQVFTENNKEHTEVHRFSTHVLSIIGVAYLAYAAYRVVTGWEAFASLDTVRQFLTPVFLSLAYLPFLRKRRLLTV